MEASQKGEFSRRDFTAISMASALGLSYSGWLPRLAHAAAANSAPKACILLWMAGGPSQTDSFDLKIGHPNGGPSKSIDTAVPGIQISEHLPGIAKQMKDLAIIRSLTTQEGDHERATSVMLTGHRASKDGISYPSMGSLFAKQLGDAQSDLPLYVSVSPFRMGEAGGPGFLGPNYAPLVVSGESNDPETRANLTIESLKPPPGLSKDSMDRRFEISQFLQEGFEKTSPSNSAKTHKSNFERAKRMITTNAKGAFQLNDEPASLRDKYGRNRFGQGCLLARRLVERGVAFVEVTLPGWDTHSDNFAQIRRLCETLDPAWSALMDDLRDRNMLASTMVVWMGEFGRTPKINKGNGRDHFPFAWSVVMGGGRIRGSQVIGSTDKDGMKVAERPVKLPDLYATMCAGIGVDPKYENISPEGRPIPLADREGSVITELASAIETKADSP